MPRKRSKRLIGFRSWWQQLPLFPIRAHNLGAKTAHNALTSKG